VTVSLLRQYLLAVVVSKNSVSVARPDTPSERCFSSSYETAPPLVFTLAWMTQGSSTFKEKGASMIAAQQVWGIIQGHVPRRTWISSNEIFSIVELHGALDAEDRQPQSPGSKMPKWKALVRSVLSDRRKMGGIRSRKRSDAGGKC
jgi:hypothetical protein